MSSARRRSRRRSRRGSSAALIFNALTALMVVAITCVAGVFLSIFTDPYSSLNPFPPLPELIIPTVPPFPSPTPTFGQQLPPTWTPSPSETHLPTLPPRPTSTFLPTETPFSLVTPPTPSPSPTGSGFSFGVQQNNPIYITNIAHQELGCNWMGVAGQAFDRSGSPVVGLAVELGGELAGVPIGAGPEGTALTLTGTATQYGPGGYEFTLADGPIPSADTLYVRLLDQAGLPISEEVYFQTFNDCERNLILLNFVQER